MSFFYSPIFPAMDLLDTFGEEFLRESIAFFTTVEIVEILDAFERARRYQGTLHGQVLLGVL